MITKQSTQYFFTINGESSQTLIYCVPDSHHEILKLWYVGDINEESLEVTWLSDLEVNRYGHEVINEEERIKISGKEISALLREKRMPGDDPTGGGCQILARKTLRESRRYFQCVIRIFSIPAAIKCTLSQLTFDFTIFVFYNVFLFYIPILCSFLW